MQKKIRSFLWRACSLAGLLVVLANGQATAQAANDNCAQAVAVPVTATCSVPVNGSVDGATQSLPPASCGGSATVAADVWYSFVASSTAQDVTLAPRFAAVLEIRSGTCAASSSVYCTTIANTNTTSRPVFGLVSGQTYFIRIYANQPTQPTGVNSTFALCVGPGPTTPPANDECAGAVPVTVSAGCANSVTGTMALATQSLPPTASCAAGSAINDVWYSFVATGTSQNVTIEATYTVFVDVRSGTCTTSTSVYCNAPFTGQVMTVNNLVSGQAYFMRIYTYSGTTASNPAFTLCIAPGPAAPTNDECASASPLSTTATCVAPYSGTLAGATQSLAPTASCGTGVTSANDVWYSFEATGTSQIITLTASTPVIVDVRSGTCTNSTSVFCASVFSSSSPPVVPTGLMAGQTYFIRIYPSTTNPPSPANSSFTLCLNNGLPPLTNDECSTAVAVAVVQSCGTSTNGSVFGATQSLPPTASCGGSTAVDVWYSFVATGPTQVVTLSPRFNATYDIRTGTCANSTSVFCGSVSVTNVASSVVNGLTAGQTFYLRVYASGTTQPAPTNSTFTLCIGPGPTPPPNDECANSVLIAVAAGCTSPVSGTVVSASQSLPTAACGVATLLAQDVWYRFVASAPVQQVIYNGQFSGVVDVRSGTCASSTSIQCFTTLTNTADSRLISGLTTGQTYFIRVYSGGSISSNATFTLCVTPAPSTPINDECTGAISLTSNVTCTTPTAGTVASATQSLPPTANCGGSGTAADVWYSFVAVAATQDLNFTTVISNFLMDVRSGACANSTSIYCGLGEPTLLTGLTAGQTYFIRVYPRPDLPTPTGSAAAFSLCIAPTPPANDNCAGALTVPVQSGTCTSQTTADNLGATNSPVLAPVCANYLGRDVWFKTTVPTSGTVTIQTVVPTTGTDAGNTGLGVYGGNCASLTLLGCDDDSGGGLKSLLTLTGRTPGEVLYIRVWGNGNASGTFAVCVTTPEVCPMPTNLLATAITATTAQVSWQASVTPPPNTIYTVEYGLQGFTLGTGTTVSAATAALGLGNLLASTDYCFYVRQSCPSGTGTSANAGPVCFRTLATPAPANDDPCGAVTLGLTATGSPLQPITGTTFGATTSNQPGIILPACSPATTPQDVWFAMTPAAGITSIRLIITGSAAGTVRVFTAPNCTTGPFTLVSCLSSGASNIPVGAMSLTGLVPGQRYYIAVSGYGNTDFAGGFTIAGAIVTAARVQMEANALFVYPNPSNIGQLTLRLSGIQGSSHATLLNALGQVVLTKTLPSGSAEQVLSTRGLATGVYTLRVVVGDAVLTRKVVLE